MATVISGRNRPQVYMGIQAIHKSQATIKNRFLVRHRWITAFGAPPPPIRASHNRIINEVDLGTMVSLHNTYHTTTNPDLLMQTWRMVCAHRMSLLVTATNANNLRRVQ